MIWSIVKSLVISSTQLKFFLFCYPSLLLSVPLFLTSLPTFLSSSSSPSVFLLSSLSLLLPPPLHPPLFLSLRFLFLWKNQNLCPCIPFYLYEVGQEITQSFNYGTFLLRQPVYLSFRSFGQGSYEFYPSPPLSGSRLNLIL